MTFTGRMGHQQDCRQLFPINEGGSARRPVASGLGNAALTRLLGGIGLWPQQVARQGAGPLCPEVAAAINAERMYGDPLSDGIRVEMQEHLGADFSSVRVHTGSRADGLSRAVDARAFTTGTDVFFRSGTYDPMGPDGRALLAHELTHVVQQANGIAGCSGGISEPTDTAEVRAREAAQGQRQADADRSRRLATPSIWAGGPTSSPAVGELAGTQRNRQVQRFLQHGITTTAEMPTPSSSGLIVSRQEGAAGNNSHDGTLHLPDDTLHARENHPTEETARVLANIASTKTRAMGYLTDTKVEVMMGVDAFRDYAYLQVEGLTFENAHVVAIVPALSAAVTAVVVACFPPVAFLPIGVAFATALAANLAVTDIKAEGPSVKAGFKNDIAKFAKSVNDAQSASMSTAGESLDIRLNDLAAAEPGVWEMLWIGGERQQEDLIARLGVKDPKKNSPYEPILSALMRTFGEWIANEQSQAGMTKLERMISESVPSSDSFKARRSSIAAGQSAAGEVAHNMAEAHRGARP